MDRPADRSRWLAAAAVLVAALVVAWVVLVGREPDAADLSVDWGGGDAGPGCVHDEATGTVEAAMRVTGEAPEGTEVTVSVTAYADEDTSEAVGSGTEVVEVGGTVDETVVVAFAVDAPPYVDVDGVTACSQSVDY